MATPQLAERIGAVRRFNRFYTRQIGLLRDGMVDTRFSLTEARVLYELGQTQETTATAIARKPSMSRRYFTCGQFTSRSTWQAPYNITVRKFSRPGSGVWSVFSPSASTVSAIERAHCA